MIIRERYSNYNILDNLPILEQTISAKMVPILENYSINEYMVKFNDLYDYANKTKKTFQEAFYDIKNENKLDYLYIAIDEALVYDYPQLLDEFNNLLLIPKNENSIIYQFCEDCMINYLETGDYNYVTYFLEADDATLKQYEQKLMRQKIAFENTRKQLSTMKQGDKQYQVANNRLMGMQQAIDNTTRMIEELKRRGSVSQQGSRDERLAAYKQAKTDAVKTTNNMINNPGTIPTKPAKTRPITPKPSSSTGTAPPSTAKPVETNPSSNPSSPANTSDKPSWFSQKWSAFKNWANSLNDTEDTKSSWFTDLLGNIKGWFGNNQTITGTKESAFLNEFYGLRRVQPHPIKPPINNRIQPKPSSQISNPNPPTSRGIGPGQNYAPESKEKAFLNNPNTVDPSTQYKNKERLMPRFNNPQQPVNAATDIDFLVNEVYRPRRLYRHRYLK